MVILQTTELINQDTLDYFTQMSDTVTANNPFTDLAISLCAIFMLLYFGIKSYEMMLGEGRLNLMPLLRPFALTMVILYWPAFFQIMGYPGEVLANRAQTYMVADETQIDLDLEARKTLIDTALIRIIVEATNIKTNKDEGTQASQNIWQQLGSAVVNALQFVQAKIDAQFVIVENQIAFILGRVIEFLTKTIFAASVYLILGLQLIYGTVLFMIGPFAFAISILPAFRDSYTAWIARYISVSLYTALAFIILHVVYTFIDYTVQQEIQRMTFLLQPGNELAFVEWARFSPGIQGYFLGGLLIGIVSMLTIPSISTWVVSTAGIGSAVGVAGKAVSTIASAGTKMAGGGK